MFLFENYKNVILRRYAKFSGRTGRKEFWSFQFIHLPLLFVLFIPYYLNERFDYVFVSNLTQEIIDTIAGVYFIFTFLPSLAVTVRRLHDSGRTGWNLLLLFVPIIGFIYFIGLLYFLIDESEREANQYDLKVEMS